MPEPTAHEKFIAGMREKAKVAGKPLGAQAQQATRRPANYCELSARGQWDIDATLGILDWSGRWDE